MNLEVLKQRVQARLTARDVSRYKASIKAGLNLGYVSDLLAGKNTNLSDQAVQALADALDCDVGYLTGAQEEVRKPKIKIVKIEAEIGWGVYENGSLDLNSVGDSRRAAIVKWISASRWNDLLAISTDAQIEHMWETQRADKNAIVATVAVSKHPNEGD